MKQTLILLTCLAMLLPGAVQAKCKSCAKGGCGAGQATADVCPRGESACPRACCEEAKTAGCCSTVKTPCSSSTAACHLTCDFCSQHEPIVLLRTSVPVELQQQLTSIAATSTATLAALDHPRVTNVTTEGSFALDSPLRLHALLGVWLN